MANVVHFMVHRNLYSEGGAECRVWSQCWVGAGQMDVYKVKNHWSADWKDKIRLTYGWQVAGRLENIRREEFEICYKWGQIGLFCLRI